VVFVPSDRLYKLHIYIAQALKLNRALGRGSELFAAEVEAVSKLKLHAYGRFRRR
jgi:hypothetical protein